MIRRPSLLVMTAAAAALTSVAHAVVAASPSSKAPATRLGVAIKDDIATRDKSAASRARALDLREQAARATEERLKAEARARQQQADAAAAGPGGPSADEAQYDALAKVYQAMKPTKAALVFEQLDMDVQMKVAQRMRERSTAMILAAMTPQGAADLSMSLARKQAKKPRPLTVVAPGKKPAP